MPYDTQAEVQPVGQTLEPGIAVGPFRLHPDRHLLTRDGATVRIGSRALSLLIVLAEKRGELVSKEALIARVWPDTFVEEANLRVHIAALRKVLGDTGDPPQFIANVSGRGYRLVAAGHREPAAEVASPRVEGGSTSLTRLIGRDKEVATLLDRIALRRLITVSGPGGIGKTTVAFAVAKRLEEAFEDGIFAVDLGAAAADEHSLPQALAMALRVSLVSGDPLSGLTAFLRDKHLLLVLDNCEHIIDAVTEISEALLRQAPRLHILATSTEPMRAEGEWIFRLLPLEVPSEAENLHADEALAIPAIELFVERAAASSAAFHFSDADVPLVSEICRRLDGNPLAIEIAAASVEAFGLRDLATHLDDRFQVLVRGRRTAAPRHQTLRNLLDWSHSTLSASEQATLRRLSIFRGAFTLEAARAIAALDGSPLAVINDIASLVRKSLVTANVSEAQATYRLLDSTRAYSRERAAEAGELPALNARHASYFEALLRRADSDWTSMVRVDWLAHYGYMIDDARAATDWALATDGNAAQAVRLTALLLPLGFQFALVEEMGERIVKALARAPLVKPRELAAEIRLLVSTSSLDMNRHTEFGDKDAALETALELARHHGDSTLGVGAMMKYAIHNLTIGNYAEGVRYADDATAALAGSGDDLAQLGIDRVLAQATNMNGEHQRARLAANRVLAHPARNIPLVFGSLQIDRRVSMRVVIARSLFMQGYASQAKAVALEAMALARNDGPYAMAMTIGLGACPIALWSGFDDEAQALAGEMLEKSERYTLGIWHLWAELFESVLARRRGDVPGQVKPSISLQADTMVTFDAQLLDDAAEARAMAGLGGWANPEILRAAAVRLARHGPDQLPAVRSLLQRSMDEAGQQGALAWELRTATTLALLDEQADNRRAARAGLEPVYRRLPEGLDRADALAARDVLERLYRG